MSGDEPKTYTHAELVEVLQRAIALKAARDRGYTPAELAAAAAELGIDAGLAEKAVAELDARRSRQAAAPRPFDTRLELEVEDGRFHLHVPPARPGARMLGPLAFATAWFSFLAFWTSGAARGSLLFAAFSLPFWLAGLAMVRRFVFPLFQVTTLDLGPGGGRLETKPLGRRRDLRPGELRARLGPHPQSRHQDEETSPPSETIVLLEHGTETFPLLEGWSDAEKRWIAAELEAYLLPAGAP
jgi:hypothetical protein